MNRKQKIIVSVTGIFLVALILMGLTYAYFLTQIKGNTNNKSISVTTANLVLTYGDGNGVLTPGDKLRPGNSVNFKTSSGTTVNEKTFTVKNDGDATDYVVIVDNVNVTPEPFESNDFIYTLTCTSSDANECEGTTNSMFPLNNKSILVGNRIESGVTHTYTLTMEYKETNIDQSDDMGKTFSAKIDIADIRSLDNPYKSNTNSLAYNIINNSISGKNGTELKASPLTKPINKTGSETEKTLSVMPDIYTTSTGISSYYYRGSVEDNYLEFNNMCWRIVRIEGDGSVKVTLAAEKPCNQLTDADKNSAFIGYGLYGRNHKTLGIVNGYEEVLGNFPDYETSDEIEYSIDGLGIEASTMKNAFNVFLNGGSFISAIYDEKGKLFDSEYQAYGTETKTFTAWANDIKEKIKTEKICIGDTSVFYDVNGEKINVTSRDEIDANYNSYIYFENYVRLEIDKVVTLNCTENAMSKNLYQVYPLTIDESLLGGSYLKDNANFNYSTVSVYGFHSLPAGLVYKDNMIELWLDIIDAFFRPAISLIEGIELASNSGDGTKNNPYRVVES